MVCYNNLTSIYDNDRLLRLSLDRKRDKFSLSLSQLYKIPLWSSFDSERRDTLDFLIFS